MVGATVSFNVRAEDAQTTFFSELHNTPSDYRAELLIQEEVHLLVTAGILPVHDLGWARERTKHPAAKNGFRDVWYIRFTLLLVAALAPINREEAKAPPPTKKRSNDDAVWGKRKQKKPPPLTKRSSVSLAAG